MFSILIIICHVEIWSSLFGVRDASCILVHPSLGWGNLPVVLLKLLSLPWQEFLRLPLFLIFLDCFFIVSQVSWLFCFWVFLDLTPFFTEVLISYLSSMTGILSSIFWILLVRCTYEVLVLVPKFFMSSFASILLFPYWCCFHFHVLNYFHFYPWLVFSCILLTDLLISSLGTSNIFIMTIFNLLSCASDVSHFQGLLE